MVKGLGDSIEKVFKKTGIDKVAKKVLGEDCGCEERKEALNKLFPYAKVRQFTEDELEIYKKLIPSIKKGSLSILEQKSAVKLYNKVFNASKQLTRCSSCLKNTIKKLESVYENSCEL
tara:strand:- start:1501 stop:1854 length:354 start_codon:yes stop_codon:yes gene_type:complete